MMEPTTDIAEWREQQKPQEHIMQLGCGLRVKVKRAQLLDLAAAGHIPLPLSGQVAELIEKGVGGFDQETLKKKIPVVNAVVKAMTISPPIVDKASDNAVGVDEIPLLDRFWMYKFAQEEAAPLAVFPVKPTDSGDSPRRRGRAVPPEAESDPAGVVVGS
jgi:hypothetical protein